MLKKQTKIAFGVDEVGRGCLGGPVFACALTKSGEQFCRHSERVGRAKNLDSRDSKKLNAKQREEIYKILKADPDIVWGIGRVGERVIDKINILQATKLAMIKAVKNLEKKIGKQANMLLIDGNFGIDIKRPQQSIVKGDEKIPLIALASIVAKVHRDRLMVKLHKSYPQYGFDKHKGYGTKQHLIALANFGVCKIHRVSFSPVHQFSKVLRIHS